MTKALLKYILSLGILLLSVYGNLYARSYQECICHSSQKSVVKSEQTSLGTTSDFHSLIVKARLFGTESESCKMVASEIEEEKHEWISFKKFLAHNNYFTSLFYILAFGYFALFFKKRLPTCKHSVYFAAYKWFLLFRVIRI
ncbi:hypothetical protein HUW51_21390 [Adhaeribacter swui]|uniref:Uncharacterized protein n=1 Tax=Adhaeribacter swui TaxID=2086471 RepID=A0A7G7GDB2_9BACT|nr:hypothetical protein [Adhaeribacter swui]QNF35146.1 hypothetical protein HUW51_21390 [Adhaeribacter swui]